MVIVSKPSPIITAPVVNQANKSSSQQPQPPLIVFDLGQQHQQQQLTQNQQQGPLIKNVHTRVGRGIGPNQKQT